MGKTWSPHVRPMNKLGFPVTLMIFLNSCSIIPIKSKKSRELERLRSHFSKWWLKSPYIGTGEWQLGYHMLEVWEYLMGNLHWCYSWVPVQELSSLLENLKSWSHLSNADTRFRSSYMGRTWSPHVGHMRKVDGYVTLMSYPSSCSRIIIKVQKLKELEHFETFRQWI